MFAGCSTIADGTVDIFIDGEGDYGSVFVCDTPCTLPNGNPAHEWCWNGSEADLEALKGDQCMDYESIDRDGITSWWPEIGCIYRTSPGSGCNAKCGCYIP